MVYVINSCGLCVGGMMVYVIAVDCVPTCSELISLPHH